MQYATIDQKADTSLQKAKRSANKKSGKARKVILFLALFLVVFGLYNFSPLLFQFIKLFSRSPGIVYSVIANKDPNIKNDNGRTNILLLGTGGGNHEAPDLTDSIIVASIDIKTGDALLISLPRDVYSEQTKSKINAIYSYAKDKDEDAALNKTEQTIGSYLGLPIHYGVRLDFAGFRKAIDTVGGIDVEVATTFDDYQYPILEKENDSCGFVEDFEDGPAPVVAETPSPSVNPDDKTATDSASTASPAPTGPVKRKYFYNAAIGKKIYAEDVSDINNPYACRYEHIHFDKGIMHMDGTLALKFVRSRHGNNGEGSDFARSRRQQAVITAFRQAVTSKETLFDIPKIQSLVSAFGSTVETDIPIEDFGDFYQVYRRVKESPIRSLALTDGDDKGEPVFVNPPTAEYGGAWVLIPRGNDWTVVQNKIREALIPPTPLPSGYVTPSPSPVLGTKTTATSRPTVKRSVLPSPTP